MESHSQLLAISSSQQNTLTEEAITHFFQRITDATVVVDSAPSTYAKASVARSVRTSYIDYVKHILTPKKNASFSRLRGNLITRISPLNTAQQFQAVINDIGENGRQLQAVFAAVDDTEKEEFIERLQDMTPLVVAAQTNVMPQSIVSGQSKADNLSPYEVALQDYQIALSCINQHVQENNYQAAVISARKSLEKIAPIYPSLSRNNQRTLLEDNIMFLVATLDIHGDACLDKALAEDTDAGERESLYEEAVQCKVDALNFADFVHANGFSDALTLSQHASSLAHTLSGLAKYYLDEKQDFEAGIKKYQESMQVLMSATPDAMLPTIQQFLAKKRELIALTQYLYSVELFNSNQHNEAKEQLQKAIIYLETTPKNIASLITCKIGLVRAMRKCADEFLGNTEYLKAIDELNRATGILEELTKKLKREKQISEEAKDEGNLNQANIQMEETKKQLALCQIHLAEIKSQYGAALHQQGKHEEAILQCERAIIIYEYFYPAETVTLPASRNNLAAACAAIADKFKQQAMQLCDENKYQDAANAGLEAFRIITPTICRELAKNGQTVLLPQYILELVARLNQTANTYLEQAKALPQQLAAQWQQGVEYQGYALNLLSLLHQNQLLGDTDINQLPALAESNFTELLNFGKYYLFMTLTDHDAANKLQEAIRKFQECRGLLETTPPALLQNSAQKEIESTQLLGLAWHRRGVVLLESENYDDGISHLEVAIGILESIKDHEKELSACQLDLVAARHRQKTQRDAVMATQREAITRLKTTDEALKNNPAERPNWLKCKIELAEMQHQHAVSRKKSGDTLGVIQLYQEAIANFSTVLASSPTDDAKKKTFACEVDFAAALLDNAEANYQAGRYISALEQYLHVMKMLFPRIQSAKENDTSKELNQCIVLLDAAKDMFRTTHHSYWKDKNKQVQPVKPGQFESALANIKRYEKFEALSKTLPYFAGSELAIFGSTSKAARLIVHNHHARIESQAKIKAKSAGLAQAIAASKAVAATHTHHKPLDNFEIALPASAAHVNSEHKTEYSQPKLDEPSSTLSKRL
jgi:hypothetical protein